MRGRFDDAILDNVLIRGTAQICSNSGHSLGFFGATPISQNIAVSPVAALSAAATLFAAGQAGFATASQADGIIQRVVQIQTALVSYGLFRGT